MKVKCNEKLSVFQFVLLISSWSWSSGESSLTRALYDSMAQLVGEQVYPDLWWDQRQTCFNNISPGLSDTLELAWKVIGGDVVINITSGHVRA